MATLAAKTNGCPATISAMATPLCERCNGANKLQVLACPNITAVPPDKLRIMDTNGFGNFISWNVMASSNFNNITVSKSCGICVKTPNNNNDTGCLAGTKAQEPSESPTF